MPLLESGRWFLVAAVVAGLDQWTKHLVQQYLGPGEGVMITPYFDLVLVFNPGAAFSFLSSASGWQREFFIIIALAASAFMSVLIVRHRARWMFGVALGEKGYVQAAEWIGLIERAYSSNQPFDFMGEYYQLKDVVSRPASVQMPRPVTMNAAFGAPGRDFAAKNCDYLFSTFAELEDGKRHVEDIRQRAAGFGREVGIYTVCHVVCRETQKEADDYYEKYAVTDADHAAVDAHMAGKKEFANSHDPRAFDLYRKRFAGGAGSYPLVGTPEKIVDDMLKISREGYAGAALTFVNYSYELPFFCDRVLPLMKQAGLRIN